MCGKTSGYIYAKLLRWFQMKKEAGRGSWRKEELSLFTLYTLMSFEFFERT